MLTAMKQIEADVVLVATNTDTGEVYVQPYWECEIHGRRLMQAAQNFGLQCAEQSGAGYVRVQIYDYRSDEIMAQLTPDNALPIYNAD